MTRILTPSLTVASRVKVKKLRELPVPGTVTVQVGQTVKASDIVASAERLGDLEIVRISERLGIEPPEVQKGLKVALNDRVTRGQLLCEHSGFFGLFKSKMLSPSEGAVEFIAERTGHIGIRLAPKRLELSAYLAGIVAAVDPKKSVLIESSAALVQGIFGVGGERHGKIHMLGVAADAVVKPDDIPPDCKGMVLVGGKCAQSAALAKAKSSGAVGFVTGSIDDRTLAEYVGFDVGVAVTGDEDVSMSVIVTEGFGEIPISSRVLNLLKPLEGKSASINGATQVRAGAVRPEIIVPHDAPSDSSSETEFSQGAGLEVGATVRLIRFPYFGLRGEVTELPHALERIDTGAFTRVLRARLEDGKIVTVPRANVEMIPAI